MIRREMEKARLNAASQRAHMREVFAHSAENRRRGPERELTQAEREDRGEGRRAFARKDKSLVDAHRVQYAAAVALQAAVMSKAARVLIALHKELHDDVRMDAGNDYGNWHPVSFGILHLNLQSATSIALYAARFQRWYRHLDIMFDIILDIISDIVHESSMISYIISMIFNMIS
jgi:hypothetical protein